MSTYFRPDDGVATAAEMVEIRPGQFVNREVARQLGLAIEGLHGGRREIRAAAPAAIRANEVVAEVRASKTTATTPPEAAPVPPAAPIAIVEGRETRDALAETRPELAVIVPRASKAKRSLREILADGQG